MRHLGCLMIALAVAVAVLGCGPSVKQERIQIKAPAASNPLEEATSLLQRYADGQPLTSEATSFPGLVERVRKEDSAKADILEAGFSELQKAPPAARPAKAKEILSKLQAGAKQGGSQKG